MPWNGKRKLKPLFHSDRCLCSECGGACPDVPDYGVRCWACHYDQPGGRHSAGAEYLSWYCAAAGHGDDRCSNRDEHKAKVGADALAIKGLLRNLDHAMDVAGDRRWGQMSFEELREAS